MIVDTKKSDTVEENNRRAERLFELMKVNLIPWIRDLLKENEMQPSDIEKMFDKKKRMISLKRIKSMMTLQPILLNIMPLIRINMFSPI